MHNSYTSSTLWSFRTKGSVSISFSDYFNLPNPKLDKTPVEASHCYSCCPCSCSCCSTLYTRKIAVSPSILYGLRQSCLIQCSPTRRFILRCGNGCLSRFLGCDLNYDDYEFSNAFRGRRSSGDGWRSMGKVKCMGSEERSSGYWLSGVADVEDVLSLLSDQVDDVCLGTIDKYQRSLRRASSGKRRDYGTECLRERMRVEVKKQSDFDSERCSGKKKIGVVEEGSGGNVRHLEKKKKDISSCLENKAEHNVKSVAINFRKEDCGRTEERESSTKADSHKRRTKCSSCSSYYSPSSTEDFESDTETLEKEAQFLKESFVENDNDSVRYEANRIGGKVGQTSVKHAGGDEEVHEERYNMAHSSSYWDLRKKSEKKLAEVSTEEMQSTNKSAEVHSKLGKTYETEHVKESGYSKQYDCEDDMNYMVSSSQRTRKENIEVSQVSQWSESHKDVSNVSEQSETQKKHQYVSEKSGLWSQNQFSTRDEMVDASTNSGRLYKNTRFLNDDTERSALQEHSESKVKRHEEKEKHLLMEQKLHQRTEFSEGSEEMINISTDVDAAISSYGSTEKRMLKQESNLKKEAKLVGETSNRYQGTSETAMHMKSGKQSSKSVIIRTPSEGADGSSSIQLSLVSQSGEQRIGKVEAEKRSTQAIVMPPLSQLVVAGSENENMTKVISKEAPGTTSESGTSTKYMASGGRTSSEFLESSGESTGRRLVEPFNVPSPEDSLGSAHRLGESSIHFVGEFIERVSHEVSTSKIQTETKSSNLKWVEEADSHGHESSNQLVKENSQRKRSESRQSSDGSGARGPSDEIWDVTETSAQEPHETEVPESSSTGEQTVIKRSGKSLWNIMVDIVRLRWGSHATSSSSAARSGGKTSPNVSAESEAWFSGRETDENSEENKKREGASVPQESIAQQLEPGKTSNQVQGEVSELIKVTANKNELEKNVSSASDESELSLKDNLSVYVEVNQGRNGSPGVMELPKSSVPLQSSRIRQAPTVEQITKVDEIGTTVSGSMEAKEQLQGLSPVEVSPESRTKGGQLQPRKLQRTKQVLRDRFDEWEEAYKLETEQRKVDEMFMKEALLEAKKAADIWEVPVGAVLVQHGKIIARGCNLVEELRDSTAHAEMICIREASNLLRSWRLADTTLYVTLEPCPMCAGAILQARIDTLVWGAPNKLLGADGSWIRIFPDGGGGNGSDQTDKSAAPVHPFHPKINIRRAVLASDCSDVMQQFFQLRRKKKKEVEKSPPPSCLPVPGHPSKLLNKMHGVFHFMFCL